MEFKYMPVNNILTGRSLVLVILHRTLKGRLLPTELATLIPTNFTQSKDFEETARAEE